MGVGITPDGQRIRIYVLEENETVPDIPKMMAGFDIEIFPISGISPASETQDPDFRERRFRPVVGGVSAAHVSVTAGTIGAVIRDKKTGDKFFLSNNHVFANTSTATNLRAHIGDPIIQPSPSDSGSLADTVATLYKFVPFSDDKSNLVDAALALPTDQGLASPYILADGSLNVISVNGMRAVSSPIRVKKYGRTSGADWGEVLDWNFTVAVDFDDGKTRNFVDQILVAIETRGGDSGALLLDTDNHAVGLVFAGGIDRKGNWYGVANKILNVLAILSDDDIDISEGWSHSLSIYEAPPQFAADGEPLNTDRL